MRAPEIIKPSSTRQTFFLIAIILLVLIISAIIPQQGISEEQVIDWKNTLGEKYSIIENLGLDRIYRTPFFFIVLGLFAINLTAVNIKRFRLFFNVNKTKLKIKYFGSILFHLSILLIIIGIITNYLYKFNGVYSLTEGQSVRDVQADYFRIFKGPLYAGDSGRFSLRLDKVHDDFKIGDATTEAADILFMPSGVNQHTTSTILTNKPLKWKNLELHFGQVTGYSPEITFSDSSGNQLFKSFVRLATRKLEGKKVYSDYILLPDHQLKIGVEFVPNDSSQFYIKVANETELLYDGVLIEGDTARFSDYAVTIPSLRRWCYIDVVESPFLWMVFTGFWTAIAGLVIGFIPRLVDQMKESK